MKCEISKCEELKVDGWIHSLLYGDSRSAYSPCSFRAKYRLKIISKKGKVEIKEVCGIHKNSITRHSKQVGYAVKLIDKENFYDELERGIK